MKSIEFHWFGHTFFEKKVCRNAISRISGHPTRFGKLKCSEKHVLQAFTIGICMWFCLEFHWFHCFWHTFLPKKVCLSWFSGFWWALPGKEKRLGQKSMFYKRLHRYFACRWVSEIARTPTETKAILMRIPLLPRGAVAVPLFSTCAKEVGVHLP